MGRLEKIWLKRAFRGPMDVQETAVLVEGRGLEGNANQGGKRQVTLLDADAWREAIAAMDADLDPAVRRANLLVRGLELAESRGRILVVDQCKLRVNGETRPCERMDEACLGLRKSLLPKWRGGAYAEVLEGGEIRVGDSVWWEE
jgi:MOSC domain-containing protein YiiM